MVSPLPNPREVSLAPMLEQTALGDLTKGPKKTASRVLNKLLAAADTSSASSQPQPHLQLIKRELEDDIPRFKDTPYVRLVPGVKLTPKLEDPAFPDFYTTSRPSPSESRENRIATLRNRAETCKRLTSPPSECSESPSKFYTWLEGLGAQANDFEDEDLPIYHEGTLRMATPTSQARTAVADASTSTADVFGVTAPNPQINTIEPTTAIHQYIMAEIDGPTSLALRQEIDISISSQANRVTGSMEPNTQSAQREDMRIEFVARSLAKNPEDESKWVDYLSSYVKGEFNLNTPPQPPPHKGDFVYLIAPYALNEGHRAELYADISPHCKRWVQGQLSPIIAATIEEFGTSYVALSWFEKDYEIFMAEVGLDRRRVARKTSISAHGIYSTEVFVVLDATKDWRFEKNPLVIGEAGIKFIAGSPMLASDGMPIGMFTIMSKEPRRSFSSRRRRLLAEYADQAMHTLLSQAELFNSSISPRQSRESEPPFWLSVPNSTSAAVTGSVQSGDPAVRYAPPVPAYGNGAQTPPPSAQSESGPVFTSMARSSQFTGSSLVGSSSPVDYRQMLNDFDQARQQSASSPRPFSDSDLTSLHLLPPNTPNRQLHADDYSRPPVLEGVTVANFMAMDDDDVLEALEDLEQGRADATSDATMNFSQGRPEHERPKQLPQVIIAPLRGMVAADVSTPPPTPADASIPVFSASVRSSGPLQNLNNERQRRSTSSAVSKERDVSTDKQIALILATHATKCNWDLMFVVKVTPRAPGMNADKMCEEGGIEFSTVAAYNMSQPQNFEPRLYLDILKVRGCFHTKDQTSTGKYTVAIYNCITGEKPRANRAAGIVVAALRFEASRQSTRDDSKQILELSDRLRPHFIGLYGQNPSRPSRIPRRMGDSSPVASSPSVPLPPIASPSIKSLALGSPILRSASLSSSSRRSSSLRSSSLRATSTRSPSVRVPSYEANVGREMSHTPSGAPQRQTSMRGRPSNRGRQALRQSWRP